MTRRGVAAVLAVAVSGACASGGKLPIYGNWRITSYQSAGGSTDSSVQALSWVGTSASYTPSEVRLGVERCSSPNYALETLSVPDFTAQYKVAPSALGLSGESIALYKVDCPKDPAKRSMVLIVKGTDNLVVPWRGTFFQLERQVTTKRSSS